MTKKHFLSAYIRTFFEDHLVCRRNVRHNTIQSYRDAVKFLLEFMVGTVKKPAATLLVSDITADLVIAFLSELEEKRGNSIQTRNLRLTGLKCLFEYIAAKEPFLLDQCRQIVTIPRKRGAAQPEISYLEKDQVTAILEAPNQSKSLGRRDHTLLLFLYNTGARVQEVADARVGWLTLSKPYKVQLLGKGRKWRTCPLWDTTVGHLQRLIEERRLQPGSDDVLFVNRFGRQLTRSGIEGIVERHVSAAATSLPSLKDKNVTPHTFRHTTAMHLLQSGVEINVIRSWLGHVSLTTTNRYVEIDLKMKSEALKHCRLGEQPVGLASWQTDPDILRWLDSL